MYTKENEIVFLSKSMKLFILKDQSTLYLSVIITLNKYPFLCFTREQVRRKDNIKSVYTFQYIAKAKGHECRMVIIMYFIYARTIQLYIYILWINEKQC